MKRPGNLSSGRFGYDRKVRRPWPYWPNLAWLRGSPDQAQRLKPDVDRGGTPTRSRGTALAWRSAWASFNAYLTSPDDPETESACQRACRSRRKNTRRRKLSRFWASACRLSAELRRDGSDTASADALPSVWRSCPPRDMGSSTGFCRQSLQGVWPPPVVPRQALAVFERAKINLDETQWYAPELRRIRGELALGNGEGLAVGRQYLLSALELSDKHTSLSWALRAGKPASPFAERSLGAKGDRVADPARHPREIPGRALRPSESTVGQAGVERFIPARQPHQLVALTACCWRRFRLTLDRLGVYLHKTDDERRNDRIVEDLGGITHVDSNKLAHPGAIRLRFGPFELNVAERSLRKAEPGHSSWRQGL